MPTPKITADQARRELARRELERRRQPEELQVEPISGSLGRTFRGLGEGLLTMGTGALAAIPAGFSGLAALGQTEDPDAAADAVRRTQEKFTFRPRTREGEIFLERGIPPMMERVDQAVSDVAGLLPGPALETAGKTSILAAPALLGKGRVQQGNLTRQQRVLKQAQEQGYVVPTSSANPTSVGRGAVEGVAGKPRMEQQASFRNQQVTNNLVAKELGVPEGTEITADLLHSLRQEWGQAYHVLDNAGTITTTVTFRRALANAIKDLKKVSKDFPELAKADSPVNQAINIANGLNKPTFDASNVATVTRLLRDNADDAFRQGQSQVGRAYRDMSKAIENAAERHLDLFGDPKVVKNFREARENIAKSYSVQEALDGDGFVSAPKLAAQKKKGKPLSGNLSAIAEFAENFPKSARVIKETPIQTGRLSSLIGLGGGTGFLAAGEPTSAALLAGMAFGGPAVRAALLSRLGQRIVGSPRGPLTGVGEALTGTAISGALADE